MTLGNAYVILVSMSKKKYTDEMLAEAVAVSYSYADIMRHFGLRPSGGNQSHMSARVKALGLDTSHFTGRRWSKGRTLGPKTPKEDILKVNPPGSNRTRRRQLKRAMLESGIEYVCSWCDLGPVWNGLPIIIEIDHISGDWNDNRLENLRFLCPNCHSQTDTNSRAGVKGTGLPLALRTQGRAERPNVGSTPTARTCADCHGTISYKATRCRSCAARALQRYKIDWPTDDELRRRLGLGNYSKLARELGVSDNAIRKRLNRT